MKPGTLMLDIGKDAPPSEGMEAETPSDSLKGEPSGDEDGFLDDAFDSLNDGDKEGFKAALRGLVECMSYDKE